MPHPNPELQDLMARANGAPWGKQCSALWAQAVQLAESLGDEQVTVHCYNELTTAYVQGGEGTRCIAPFIWLDKKLKERPELFTEDILKEMAWHYKSVVWAMRSVPQVPYEQIKAVEAEMKAFFLQRGDSLRAYYQRAYMSCQMAGDLDGAEENMRRWLESDIEHSNDCSGCDPMKQAIYHLDRGEDDEALRIGYRALADTHDSCPQQPALLLCHMIMPLVRAGHDDQAWAAFIRAYRKFMETPYDLTDLDLILQYLVLTGRNGHPERLERAEQILFRHLVWINEAETPELLMTFAAGAALVTSSMAERGQERFPMALQGSSLSWFQAGDIAEPTTRQATEWFTHIALGLAEQFDARPGILRPMTVARVTAYLDDELAPEAIAQLTREESDIPDVTGLKAQHVLDRMGSATSEPEEAEDEAPLVPLTLDGHWHQMTEAELIEAHLRLDCGEESVYTLELAQRLIDHPNVELVTSGDDPRATLVADNAREFVSYWQRKNIRVKLNANADGQVVNDPAYALLDEAIIHLQGEDFLDACQQADAAMRMESVEPIGLRIRALKVLSDACHEAGYRDDARTFLRDRINLLAFCGFRAEQLLAQAELIESLNEDGHHNEAALVGESAKLLVEAYPDAAIRLRLGDGACTALKGLGNHAVAAQELIAASKWAEKHGMMLPSVEYLRNAAAAQLADLHAERGLDTLQQACSLAEYWILLNPTDAELHEELGNCYYNLATVTSRKPGRTTDEELDQIQTWMAKRLAIITEYPPEDTTPEFMIADWHHDMVMYYLRAGRLSEAAEQTEEAMRGYLATDNLSRFAMVANTMADAYLDHELYPEARGLVDRVLAHRDHPELANSRPLQMTRTLARKLSSQGY